MPWAAPLNIRTQPTELKRYLHDMSLIADQATYDANMRRIEAREARSLRLKTGKGNIDDLRSKLNAMNS